MTTRASARPPCASPCIGVCRLKPAERICEGCFRSIAEIGEWTGAAEDRRREICSAAEARRSAAAAAAGAGRT